MDSFEERVFDQGSTGVPTVESIPMEVVEADGLVVAVCVVCELVQNDTGFVKHRMPRLCKPRHLVLDRTSKGIGFVGIEFQKFGCPVWNNPRF